jgi:hypothetical protein
VFAYGRTEVSVHVWSCSRLVSCPGGAEEEKEPLSRFQGLQVFVRERRSRQPTQPLCFARPSNLFALESCNSL